MKNTGLIYLNTMKNTGLIYLNTMKNTGLIYLFKYHEEYWFNLFI